MNTMIHVAPKAHADEVLHLSHLSEEQIDDQLIGDLSAASASPRRLSLWRRFGM
jgi:hypothetical protein